MNQIDTFEAMLARGQDSEMLRFTLGNAYWKDEQLDKACEHLRQAVAIKPEYSAAWKVLGRVLFAAGKLEEARDAFQSGMDVAERNGDKQTIKEITVFMRRVDKTLDAG